MPFWSTLSKVRSPPQSQDSQMPGAFPAGPSNSDPPSRRLLPRDEGTRSSRTALLTERTVHQAPCALVGSPSQRQDEVGIGRDDIFIALMGITGAGKSTFISHCTSTHVEIGHGMTSCTQEVMVYPCQYSPSRKIFLVDNPGFDDSNRTDTDVLRQLAAWLTATYKQNIRLAGIIYLHRITDDKMQGSAKRSLFMFRKLCGNDALSKVILATTKWEEVTEQKGAEREKQLSETEDFWGYMKRNGSQIRRHFNTRDSAMDLISYFVSPDPKASGMVLDIQAQMVDQGKSLDETTAGMEIQAELLADRKKNEIKIAELQADLRQAQEENDPQMIKAIEEERRKLETITKRLDRDNAGLKATVDELRRDNSRRLAAEAKSQQQLKAAEQRIAKLEHDKKLEKMNNRASIERVEGRYQVRVAEIEAESKRAEQARAAEAQRAQLHAYRAKHSKLSVSAVPSSWVSTARTEPQGPTVTMDRLDGRGPVTIPPDTYTREGGTSITTWFLNNNPIQKQNSIDDFADDKAENEDTWSPEPVSPYRIPRRQICYDCEDDYPHDECNLQDYKDPTRCWKSKNDWEPCSESNCCGSPKCMKDHDQG